MANIYRKWLYVPERYHLVVGDTFELFYRGIIHCSDPYIYNIEVKCSKGSAYRRKYMFTPTSDDIGEHKLTISISNDYGDELDRAEVILEVNPVAESPKDDTYVLCIGDSLTAGGIWPSECYRRFTASDGEPCGHGLNNLHFIGTKKAEHGAWAEGYGGWRIEHFLEANYHSDYYSYFVTPNHTKTEADRYSCYTDGVSKWTLDALEDGGMKLRRLTWQGKTIPTGTLKYISGGVDTSDIEYTEVKVTSNNPFFNEADGCVDFKWYAGHIGAPRIDICFILLGWNSYRTTEAEYKPYVRAMIENIRRSFPECKIVFMGIETPADQNALGYIYGASWDFMTTNAHTKRLEGWYNDIAAEYDNIDVINISGQFDSENSFETKERTMNIRSAKPEEFQANGIHPNREGYYQIADAMYRKLNAMLCKINRKDAQK